MATVRFYKRNCSILSEILNFIKKTEFDPNAKELHVLMFPPASIKPLTSAILEVLLTTLDVWKTFCPAAEQNTRLLYLLIFDLGAQAIAYWVKLMPHKRGSLSLDPRDPW